MAKKTQQAKGGAQALNYKAILIAVLAVLVVAAAIVLVLYFTNRVPDGAAAKVGDTYITEEQVADKIATYRTNYGLTDDEDFADFLNYYGQTVSQFRESAINEIATQMLVEQRAEELGITVTDEEVDEHYAELAGDNDTSEGSMWATVMESAGLTEDDLKERYHYSIMQDKVLAAEVPERDATDDEIVYYAQEYLAETTQVHISHIVVEGDAAESVAQKCYDALVEARDAGTLTNEVFAEAAATYSTEEDAESTGGSVGWSGCGLLSDEVLEAINDMESDEIVAGTLMGCYEREDGSYEIAYIDDTYTFPASSDISSVSDLGASDDLMEVVKSAAKSQVSYPNDCSSYLTKLLESASITYYSMPNDADYIVSLS